MDSSSSNTAGNSSSRFQQGANRIRSKKKQEKFRRHVATIAGTTTTQGNNMTSEKASTEQHSSQQQQSSSTPIASELNRMDTETPFDEVNNVEKQKKNDPVSVNNSTPTRKRFTVPVRSVPGEKKEKEEISTAVPPVPVVPNRNSRTPQRRKLSGHAMKIVQRRSQSRTRSRTRSASRTREEDDDDNNAAAATVESGNENSDEKNQNEGLQQPQPKSTPPNGNEDPNASTNQARKSECDDSNNEVVEEKKSIDTVEGTAVVSTATGVEKNSQPAVVLASANDIVSRAERLILQYGTSSSGEEELATEHSPPSESFVSVMNNCQNRAAETSDMTTEPQDAAVPAPAQPPAVPDLPKEPSFEQQPALNNAQENDSRPEGSSGLQIPDVSYYEDPSLEMMEDDSEVMFDMKHGQNEKATAPPEQEVINVVEEDAKNSLPQASAESTDVGVPAPPSVVAVDPEWDISKLQFQTIYDKSSKETQNMDSDDNPVEMFETGSWAKTNASFSTVANQDIEEMAQKLMKVDEKTVNTANAKTVAMLRREKAKEEEETKEKEAAAKNDSGEGIDDCSGVDSKQEGQSEDAAGGLRSFVHFAEDKKVKSSDGKERLAANPPPLQNQTEDDPAWALSTQQIQSLNAVGTSNNTNASKNSDTPDMFENSSWANTDVAFSEVSLSKLMNNAYAEAVGDEDKVDLTSDDKPLVMGKSSSCDHDDEIVEGLGESQDQAMKDRIQTYTSPNETDDGSSKADGETTSEDDQSQGEADVAYADDVPEDDPAESDFVSEGGYFAEKPAEASTSPLVRDVPTFGVTAAAAVDVGRANDIPIEANYAAATRDEKCPDESDIFDGLDDVAAGPARDAMAVIPEGISTPGAEPLVNAGKGRLQIEGLNFVKQESENDEVDGSTLDGGSTAFGSVMSSLAGEHFLSGASVDGNISLASTATRNKRGDPGHPRLPPGGSLPPPPPPPTPPSKKKKKKKKKKKDDNSGKSGESKGRSAGLAGALESVEEQKTGDPATNPSGNDQIEEPPEVQRFTAPEEEPKLFSSPDRTKVPKSPSPEKAISPNDGHLVISDKKIAEKVALASSAAAVKFEQTLKLEKEGSPARYSNSGMQLQESPLDVSSPNRIGSPQAGGSGMKDYLSPLRSPTSDDDLGASGLGLVGGAFSSWKDSDFKPREDQKLPATESAKQNERAVGSPKSRLELSLSPLAWFCKIILQSDSIVSDKKEDFPIISRLLLEDDSNFNSMCEYLANTVNQASTNLDLTSFDEHTISTVESYKTGFAASTSMDSAETPQDLGSLKLRPMVLSDESRKLPPNIVAANFVSFLFLASKLSSTPSPFGDDNPFLANIVDLSLDGAKKSSESKESASTPQTLIFEHHNGRAESILEFVYDACMACQINSERTDKSAGEASPERLVFAKEETPCAATPAASNRSERVNRLLIVPESHPSPFESSVWNSPRILAVVLSFLGNPVAVCRMKMVSRFCKRIINENEHMLMQQAVRVGGLSMNVRPAFWMWVTLQKCGDPDRAGFDMGSLEEEGRLGKWHSVIERDVQRSFGNMPPHKTGAMLRSDSIVKALVTWGKNRIMTRGVKGGGDLDRTPELGPKQDRKEKDHHRRMSTSSPPWECVGETNSVDSDASQTPTETVSDWGGVTPVASFTGSFSGLSEGENARVRSTRSANTGHDAVLPAEELALSGNSLSNEMKIDLQNKLRFILHSLASSHEDVGYCQGMDYVVAHLLRILQDTIKWKAIQGTLPPIISAASNLPDLTKMQEESPILVAEEVDKSCVVEEVVFRVMDTFFTTYNLRHMYWPELRCLKTCCRVFERLIQIKLPVLADHFEHHELNVGLFALGWFQTLFLYLPSMPSATVCHMWDIWLVERSLKIFFRVGTAILFLSQPILLNHELEGMMTYLNTIPDATLLKPDILIACALNIKVTNRLLQELEEEVTTTP